MQPAQTPSPRLTLLHRKIYINAMKGCPYFGGGLPDVIYERATGLWPPHCVVLTFFSYAIQSGWEVSRLLM